MSFLGRANVRAFHENPNRIHHHISVIVTVCRGPFALGIYSTHGTPSFMDPLWLQKRNSGCILPLSYAYFALSESVGH